MNPITQVFQQKSKNVLAVYTTAGFPEKESLLDVLPALQQAGVDIIEVGIPFSDPLADGPVIQQTSMKALANGMQMELLFEQLEQLRIKMHTPIVLMGYLNPVLQFGMQKFLNACKRCGIAGVILPDLPTDVYEQEYRKLAEAAGIHFIFLITPATPEERIRQLVAASGGFLYAVANAAVTGSQQQMTTLQENYLRRIRDYQLQLPVLVGFGIHDADTFNAVCRYASGAIVGSAFLRLLEDGRSPEQAIQQLLQRLNFQPHDRTVAS
jgi:tryptophan synthase alpha chain